MTRNMCGINHGGCVNASPVMRRDATQMPVGPFIIRGVEPFRGLKPTATFGCRYATGFVLYAVFRGLKPTATIMMSLRDHGRRSATIDGSRAFQRPEFQRPVARTPIPSRRIATIDRSRGFQPTDHQPYRMFRRVATVDRAGVVVIQKNLEDLGV